MGNPYYIYRFSYHIFSGGTILLINCQKDIIQHHAQSPTTQDQIHGRQ